MIEITIPGVEKIADINPGILMSELVKGDIDTEYRINGELFQFNNIRYWVNDKEIEGLNTPITEDNYHQAWRLDITFSQVPPTNKWDLFVTILRYPTYMCHSDHIGYLERCRQSDVKVFHLYKDWWIQQSKVSTERTREMLRERYRRLFGEEM